MVEDLADHRGIEDEGEDPHVGTALAADQGIDLVDPANELRPGSAATLPVPNHFLTLLHHPESLAFAVESLDSEDLPILGRALMRRIEAA